MEVQDLKFEEGRDYGYSALTTDVWSFGSIVKSSLTGRGATDFDVFFSRFHSQWCRYQEWILSQNVATFLGLTPSSNSRRFPAWATALPWHSTSARANTFLIPKATRRQRRNQDFPLPRLLHGKGLMEFDALASAIIHATQFWELHQSISVNGFDPSLNDLDPLTAQVLRAGNVTVWVPFSGFHRTVIGSVLGLESLPFRVRSVITESEVSDWPNVRNGSYSELEAMHVFEMLCEGQLLPNHQKIMASM